MCALEEASQIRQLYPINQEVSLNGLYLAHDIRKRADGLNKPYIYANFVTSIDGRIAVPHPSGDGLTVPQNTANARDWRLFQELVAQAAIVISSGRYLRDWAAGRAQEILRVDDPLFADLRTWRKTKGLSPQPDFAIISRALDFPIPDLLRADGRRVVVFTTAQAAPKKVAEVEAKLGRVFIAGESAVDGRQVADELARLNYDTVYSAAGPRILHMLLSAGVLNRLYLTQVSRIIGGDPFATIVEGSLFPNMVDFQLDTLYWDPEAFVEEERAIGQLLFAYDSVSTR